MNRIKKFRIPLGNDTILDVRLEVESGEIKEFALNMRSKIGNDWREVYRVDTAHGYLHEQRFWISAKPTPIKQQSQMQYAFEHYMEQIKNNFERYRKYYLEKSNRR